MQLKQTGNIESERCVEIILLERVGRRLCQREKIQTHRLREKIERDRMRNMRETDRFREKLYIDREKWDIHIDLEKKKNRDIAWERNYTDI